MGTIGKSPIVGNINSYAFFSKKKKRSKRFQRSKVRGVEIKSPIFQTWTSKSDCKGKQLKKKKKHQSGRMSISALWKRNSSWIYINQGRWCSSVIRSTRWIAISGKDILRRGEALPTTTRVVPFGSAHFEILRLSLLLPKCQAWLMLVVCYKSQVNFNWMEIDFRW